MHIFCKGGIFTVLNPASSVFFKRPSAVTKSKRLFLETSAQSLETLKQKFPYLDDKVDCELISYC